MQTFIGVMFNIFCIIAVFGVPAADMVFFFIFLAKFKKCSADDTEKKKLLKT